MKAQSYMLCPFLKKNTILNNKVASDAQHTFPGNTVQLATAPLYIFIKRTFCGFLKIKIIYCVLVPY